MADDTGSNLLDRLKAEHAQLAEKRTIDLPLPGYSALIGRFKAVGREVITDLKDRAQQVSPEEEAAASRAFDADLLINTCEGIYERNGESKLVALNTLLDEWGDEPIVFDERLAAAVGAELRELAPGEAALPRREIVFAIFRVDEPDTGNDVRFGQFAGNIWKWIHGGHQQADADF